MNIFILDTDKEKCAQYHCDKHLIKMILESVQILSTVVNESGGIAPYKSTHKKHPCTLWAMKSLSNWLWLKEFVSYLNKEKIYRYGKPHKSALLIENIQEPNIPDFGLTKFVMAMPNKYKCNKVVKSYRRYYICNKKHFATWKNRPIPYFMK